MCATSCQLLKQFCSLAWRVGYDHVALLLIRLNFTAFQLKLLVEVLFFGSNVKLSDIQTKEFNQNMPLLLNYYTVLSLSFHLS